MSEQVDCIVIGAGVVGLAVARALARGGREVVVVEAENQIGSHTSSRNTGVIHAGIDYPVGSLKARLCRRGKELLYRYCGDRGLAHRRLGKLILAAPGSGAAGRAALAATKAKAEALGLTDLAWLDQAEMRRREPALVAPVALFSPSSGIVDQHDLMLALRGDLEADGGALALASPAEGGAVRDDGFDLRVGGLTAIALRCRVLINSAGFDAPRFAAAISGVSPANVPPRRLMKGSYFVLAGRSPFRHLVYPQRHGMHASLDMAGALRFGPDSEWVETVDYRVDETRAPKFYGAIREFWPDLPDGALMPGWAGIRPKISDQRANRVDFRIDGPELHGIPGLINLFGIESPGLTAALAIGEEVAARLGMTLPPE
jgi:L-2-hydroxyglutarate oxidase LhgO